MRLQTLAQATHTEALAVVVLVVAGAGFLLSISGGWQSLERGIVSWLMLAGWLRESDPRYQYGGADWLGRPIGELPPTRIERLLGWLERRLW